MGIFNFLVLYAALITNISADNATTNKNTIETTSVSTAIAIETTAKIIEQAAPAEAKDSKPDTNNENKLEEAAAVPPQNQSAAEGKPSTIMPPESKESKPDATNETKLEEATANPSQNQESKESKPDATNATKLEETTAVPPQNQPAADAKPTTSTPQAAEERKEETATCALIDQPHDQTEADTPKESTTPSFKELPRKPSLRQRMQFHGQHNHLLSDEEEEGVDPQPSGPIPCTCGVFLSGQFRRGSKEPPRGLPVLTQEMDNPFMNNAMGHRQCTNKCLELIIKHLPKSSEIICATVDREHVFKERAYLFIKNHSDKWHGTNLSAGREFCCRENVPYKCPVK